MTPDPRRNVASASESERLDNCPGSRKAAAECPPLPPSEDAESGTRIHAALETGPMTDAWEALSPAEVQTAGMCWNQMLQVVCDWDGQEDSSADIAEDLWNRGDKERRLGLTALGKVMPVTPESRATFVFTGMSDVTIRQQEKALILDYKSGRDDVDESADNAQLRALAVLESIGNGHNQEITVAVIQPWVSRPKPAVFDAAALEAAKAWLMDLLERERRSTPDDLHAGDWCKYCDAQVNCPAFHAAARAIAKPMSLETIPVGKEKESLFARAMELNADTLLGMKDRLHLLGMMANAVDSAVRRRVGDGDPEVCARWQLVPGKKVRKITDAAKAFAALQPHGISLEDLWAAADLSLGPLEAALQLRSGRKQKKGGGESAHFNLTLEGSKEKLTEALTQAGALELKQCATQLKEVQQSLE